MCLPPVYFVYVVSKVRPFVSLSHYRGGGINAIMIHSDIAHQLTHSGVTSLTMISRVGVSDCCGRCLLAPLDTRDFLSSLHPRPVVRWVPPADLEISAQRSCQNVCDNLAFYVYIHYLETSSKDNARSRSRIVEQSTFWATAWRKKNLVDGRFIRNWNVNPMIICIYLASRYLIHWFLLFQFSCNCSLFEYLFY